MRTVIKKDYSGVSTTDTGIRFWPGLVGMFRGDTELWEHNSPAFRPVVFCNQVEVVGDKDESLVCRDRDMRCRCCTAGVLHSTILHRELVQRAIDKGAIGA
jgi:hypothetical protein